MKDILDNEGDNVSHGVPPNWFTSSRIHTIKSEAEQIKDSIREHKWLKGEKGQSLTWDEAKGEWIRNLPPEKRRTAELAEQVEPFMLLDE